MFNQFVELFPVLVLWAFGWMLPVSVLALVFVHLKRHGYLRPFADLFHAARRLSPVGWLCVAPLVLGLVGYASVKNDGGSTNGVPARSRGDAGRGMVTRSHGDTEAAGIGWRVPQTPVTQEEIEAGWRAPAEGAAGIVPPPGGSVTNERWRLRGAHDDAFRPELAEWRFPVRDGALTGLTVLARGEIRPDVGTLYFPVPLTNGLSLLPRSRWDLLARAPEAGAQPNGGEPASGGAPVPGAQASVFWHAQSPSNSLLLTWENALAGRDPNCPTNLQAELYPDGRFAWRTDGGSQLYLPVLDFDWDGDGLENSVDPDPLVAGPDAHGTNAEWYRVVCTNVFTEVDVPSSSESNNPDNSNNQTMLPPGVDFRPDVNSNGVYFVELVAEQGPAPVYVVSRQSSLLGSPVLVALPGETNRVPLAIGVTYDMTSSVPFSVGLPMGGFAELLRDEPTRKTVKWPLEFTFTEQSCRNGVRTYSVGVGPFDPGGHFSWEQGPASRGRPAFMSAEISAPACGCVSVLEDGISFSCSPTCTCGGTCEAHVEYFTFGAVFAATGGVCRCGFDDPHPEEPVEYDEDAGPSVSVAFSQPAVVFEEAYEDSPGLLKPRRSTRVRLTVSAYGGAFGGTVMLAPRNLGRLVEIDEGPIDLPESRTLAPREAFHSTCIYEAGSVSEAAGDVSVSGLFFESGTGMLISSQTELTSVQVTVKPDVRAPANGSEYRHTFGVYEIVNLDSRPSGAEVAWHLDGGGDPDDNPEEGYVEDGIGGMKSLRCPLYRNGATLRASCNGVDYRPAVTFREPSGVLALNPRPVKGAYAIPRGIVGSAMWLDLYVEPMDVSFTEIAVVEVPSNVSSFSGYFEHSYPADRRSHNVAAKAGEWHDVQTRCARTPEAGIGNFFMRDTVSTGMLLAVDEYGEMSWAIPMGWHRKGTQGNAEPFRQFARGLYWHDFKVWTNGDAWVRKHGHELLRHESEETGALDDEL